MGDEIRAIDLESTKNLLDKFEMDKTTIEGILEIFLKYF